jgi:hypothetical protein
MEGNQNRASIGPKLAPDQTGDVLQLGSFGRKKPHLLQFFAKCIFAKEGSEVKEVKWKEECRVENNHPTAPHASDRTTQYVPVG